MSGTIGSNNVYKKLTVIAATVSFEPITYLVVDPSVDCLNDIAC
jgi:hypothetical protein